MTLRDARDLALDELASLVDISYKEEVNGVVRAAWRATSLSMRTATIK